MRSHLALVVALLAVATSCTSKKKHTHTGVYSNEAEGFKTITVMIHEDGLAYFHAAVMGTMGEWEFDKSSSTLSIKVIDPSSTREETLKLTFDGEDRTYTMVRPGGGGGHGAGNPLHFITDEIPKEMVQAFEAYPEQLKKIKAQVRATRELRKRREEQLEQERPEYERALAQIRENPESVLSREFYGRGETPKTRAFQVSLRDHDFRYPEEVLIGLLEQQPDDNPWVRNAIFTRPELGADTVTRFYAKALEWGEMNYTVLANIAKHPNTPIEILRDLAGRDELALGAIEPARRRLKEIEDGKKPQ